ncbi:hypothetical protein P7K49_002949 [Saguinus oedipus]|uniref:Uncharacterized protein n=1 Tax=Saguinus oedipus TaxID=9490 RepID=A0ABQ9WIS6_SAGOE|nr:hypothetical protein P7K49_002949 [Saguinus oedipus]
MGPAQGRAKGPAEVAGYAQRPAVLQPDLCSHVGTGPSQGHWEWALRGLSSVFQRAAVRKLCRRHCQDSIFRLSESSHLEEMEQQEVDGKRGTGSVPGAAGPWDVDSPGYGAHQLLGGLCLASRTDQGVERPPLEVQVK